MQQIRLTAFRKMVPLLFRFVPVVSVTVLRGKDEWHPLLSVDSPVSWKGFLCAFFFSDILCICNGNAGLLAATRVNEWHPHTSSERLDEVR
jgi:hypothetical protein